MRAHKVECKVRTGPGSHIPAITERLVIPNSRLVITPRGEKFTVTRLEGDLDGTIEGVEAAVDGQVVATIDIDLDIGDGACKVLEGFEQLTEAFDGNAELSMLFGRSLLRIH